jgi:hypothetical protein
LGQGKRQGRLGLGLGRGLGLGLVQVGLGAVHHHPAEERRDEADSVGQRAVEGQRVAPASG